jgi:hypothetical protein
LFVLQKNNLVKNLMPTNRLYFNEEVLEENPGFQGELFVPLFSKKQTTNRGVRTLRLQVVHRPGVLPGELHIDDTSRR